MVTSYEEITAFQLRFISLSKRGNQLIMNVDQHREIDQCLVSIRIHEISDREGIKAHVFHLPDNSVHSDRLNEEIPIHR